MNELYYEDNWNRATYLVYCGFVPEDEAVPYNGSQALVFEETSELLYAKEQYPYSEYKACNDVFKSVVMPKINKLRPRR